jgi:hypothetical protein
MAAWGLSRETVVKLVSGAKRSPSFRRLRDRLASDCPLDLWVEDGLGFVEFELRESPRPGWLVFAVGIQDGRLVAAKSLEPDELGRNLVVADLLA